MAIKQTPPPVQAGPYVYVGGFVFGQNGKQGVYYKNSSLNSVAADTVKLDTIKNSLAVTSIISGDSSVYMAAAMGGYFKNDSFVAINTASQIWYLAPSATNVYAAGVDAGGNLAYWANSNEVNISNTFNRSVFPNEGLLLYALSGMALKGNDVLVSGSFSFSDEPGARHPLPDSTPGVYETVWYNGALQVLDHNQYWEYELNYPSTAGIAVSDTDVYVAGDLPDSLIQGGYWKNGVWNAINNGAFKPTCAYAAGTDVYITGDTYTSPQNTTAVYWKNGNQVTLDGGAIANAITVYGQDVYVLGVDYDNNNVVWKNGGLLEVLGPTSAVAVTCIAVGK